MRTIALIPARCGSKSIPLKNIKDFCGRPLIYWSIKALVSAKEIDKIYVASDCDEIKEIVLSFGFKNVEIYDRDSENAQDESSTESLVLEFIDKKDINSEDLLILVQATMPLLKSNDISSALKLYDKSDADSLLTCVRTKNFYWSESGHPLNYDYLNRPRRQDFDGNIVENGSFYINRIKNIKTHKNRLSGKIIIYEMPTYTSIEIDENDDWIIAESLMKKYILPHNGFKKGIKLFVTDVDGVLTDSGMYYSENGDEMKKFNTRDGKGIELLRDDGIVTAIMTAEDTKIVEKRGIKLKFDYIFQGIKNKKDEIIKLADILDIPLDEIAFIGDDVNDTEALKIIGLSACPADAVRENKIVVDFICQAKGGQGAVREFIDEILLNFKEC
ncbi:MAG: acylneuraminate cytidylyltransferase [Bacteroidetes bacterium]|nr:acylneuraminate cytidylyltransferase [Bacteroidota bacterium]